MSKKETKSETKDVESETKDTESVKIQEFNALKQEYASMKDTLQRIQAEFVNFRNRTESERTRFVNLANEELIKKLLPLADNFSRAFSQVKEETEFSKGISLIYAQLNEILEDEGVKPIIASGDFNPNLHEVLLVEEGKEDNKIIEELQKGYLLGDKVIRHSKVKLSKKSGGK